MINKKEIRHKSLIRWMTLPLVVESIKDNVGVFELDDTVLCYRSFEDLDGLRIKEWMMPLLGFRKVEVNGSYWTIDNFHRFAFRNGVHCSIGDDNSGVAYAVINYVHQLQDAIKVFSGEELPIENLIDSFRGDKIAD